MLHNVFQNVYKRSCFFYSGEECSRLSAVEHELVPLSTSSCHQSLNTTRVRNDVTCGSVSRVQVHSRLNQENFDEAELPVENRVDWLMIGETDVKHV